MIRLQFLFILGKENEEVGQEVPSETIPITEEVVPVTANIAGEGSEG